MPTAAIAPVMTSTAAFSQSLDVQIVQAPRSKRPLLTPPRIPLTKVSCCQNGLLAQQLPQLWQTPNHTFPCEASITDTDLNLHNRMTLKQAKRLRVSCCTSKGTLPSFDGTPHGQEGLRFFPCETPHLRTGGLSTTLATKPATISALKRLKTAD